MRDGKTVFQKAILPCFDALNVASLFFDNETEWETIDLEPCLILEARSSIVAVMEH